MLQRGLVSVICVAVLALSEAAVTYDGFKPIQKNGPQTHPGRSKFQPLPEARGLANSRQFPLGPPQRRTQGASLKRNPQFDSKNSFANKLGLASEPTQTFYVNVPQENYPPPKPIAAGPPRKHYRIVFIRSPNPPPPQPILPPRTEQKTLIYVLHPKQQNEQQNFVEVPSVAHDPQVFFVQYDNEPPTADDLQELVKNSLDIGDPTLGGNFNFGGSGGNKNKYPGLQNFGGGSPGAVNVLPPGTSGQSFLNKRGAEKQTGTGKTPQTSGQTIKSASRRTVPELSKKRPSFFSPRTPIQRASDSLKEKKRFSRNPIEPPPELKAAFDGSFEFAPFSFGGKLDDKENTKTKVKDEES